MFSLKYLPHKEPDEKVFFALHRHGFILFIIAMAFLLVAFLPLGVYFLIKAELLPMLENEFFLIFLRLLVFVFYLFWWLFFYYVFLDYYLDIWIVTNYRVIAVEQRGLFNRVVSEYKLFRIQDVMAEQKGVFATVVDFGTVHVQTAGEQQTVDFQQVPNPNHVARELIRLIEFNKQKLAKAINNKDGNEDKTI